MFKRKSIYIIILYIVILISIGVFSFYKYINNLKTIETIDSNIQTGNSEKLYFSTTSGISFIELNDLTTKEIISGSGISQFSLFNNKVAYENASNNVKEIYLSQEDESKVILSNRLPGFSNFENFTSPKFSSGSLIFAIAKTNGTDYLVSVENANPANYTNHLKINGELINYLPISNKEILLLIKEADSNKVVKYNLESKTSDTIYKDSDTISDIAYCSNKIYASVNSVNSTQIINISKESQPQITEFQKTKITDIECNSELIAFLLEENKLTDLYMVKSDGENLQQLTTGGKTTLINFQKDNTISYVYDKTIYTKRLNESNSKKLSTQDGVILNLNWSKNE